MEEQQIINEQEQQEQTKKKSGRHLSPQEQLARIAEQQKQLAARARAIRAREESRERKARAHRLIQIGGVVESVYGDAIDGEAMLRALEKFLRDQNARGNFFSTTLNAAKGA